MRAIFPETPLPNHGIPRKSSLRWGEKPSPNLTSLSQFSPFDPSSPECDYCRTRKIACDRGFPCSNCTSARLSCSYSKVAPTKATPKQRILLSSQYEKKIDDIASGIEDLKTLLEKRQDSSEVKQSGSSLETHSPFKHRSSVPPKDFQGNSHPGDQSVYIVNFVNCVIGFPDPEYLSLDSNTTVSSLKSLVKSLQSPSRNPDAAAAKATNGSRGAIGMPPLDAAISVLRWVKDHSGHPQVAWISRILPLSMLTDICRKVYFAIDEYSDVEFILANGSLSYVFAVHAALTGTQEYRVYPDICRGNVRDALRRLPLLLPTSMETVAALIFGALNAIESSDSAVAWTLVSKAADLCQRMGWENLSRLQDSPESLQCPKASLFGIVFDIEKALSLRLGRASSLQDRGGALSAGTHGHRLFSWLQEYAQDRHSRSLIASADGQVKVVDELLEQLKESVREAQREVLDTDLGIGPVEVICLQSELASQSSLLFLILDWIYSFGEDREAASANLAAIARDILDLSQHHMKSLCSWTEDMALISNYVDWCTWHTSFAAFSIIFSRAVSSFDFDDLGRLESFVASVKMMETVATKADCHPYRLYHCLAEAARLHVEGKLASSLDFEDMMRGYDGNSGEFDFASLEFDMEGS